MGVAKYSWVAGAAFAMLFVGCQHAAITYSLRREGPDPVLFPPTQGTHSSESSPSLIAIQHARQTPPKIAACDIVSDVISLRWQRTTAYVSMHSQSFFTTSADQSPMQVDRGIYLDPLLAIEKFRVDLADRQSKGCLRANESERLRRAIVESLPLPPAVAYFFQLGSYEITGYLDLTSDFRMQITSPIYPANATPSPDSLMGYETANYKFLTDGPDGRARLRLASAIEVLIGAVPIEKQSLRNELPFSKSPGYFRLLFMSDETSSGRITRAILLSSPDGAKLTRAVVHRQVNPDNFCATLSIADVTCTVFPKNFGVSPELRVCVNGKDGFVRVGGTLGEVLNLENQEDGPPRGLKVRRPFRGRLIPIEFDRSNGDILRFVLLPGDQVTF